jgi:hypothetical protein
LDRIRNRALIVPHRHDNRPHPWLYAGRVNVLERGTDIIEYGGWLASGEFIYKGPGVKV